MIDLLFYIVVIFHWKLLVTVSQYQRYPEVPTGFSYHDGTKAHHLDLRGNHSSDPTCVKVARDEARLGSWTLGKDDPPLWAIREASKQCRNASLLEPN
jgi:hypothetical protein